MSSDNIFSYQEPLKIQLNKLENILASYAEESALVDKELKDIQE